MCADAERLRFGQPSRIDAGVRAAAPCAHRNQQSSTALLLAQSHRLCLPFLFVTGAIGANPICFQGAEDYGYRFEECCSPELDPVGNIRCWWDGYDVFGTQSRGDYSYWKCCNSSFLERWRPMLVDIMEQSKDLPYLVTYRVALELDKHGLLPSRYAVNFGAADGTSTGEDPVVPLFQHHGFAGLAVEPDANKAAKLRENMPAVVRTFAVGATPQNVGDILRDAGAPAEPALLKVDIDSFDCAVMLATLRVSRPAIVQIEVNSEVPFPLMFGVHYSPDFRHSAATGRQHGWFSRGFFGCSVALAAELARPFGYDVVGQAGAHDLLLMRGDLRRALRAKAPDPPLLAYTPEGAARAISVRSMKDYFGVGVGVSWFILAETRFERLLPLVRFGLEVACAASQGQTDSDECALNYSLGLDAAEFAELY